MEAFQKIFTFWRVNHCSAIAIHASLKSEQLPTIWAVMNLLIYMKENIFSKKVHIFKCLVWRWKCDHWNCFSSKKTFHKLTTLAGVWLQECQCLFRALGAVSLKQKLLAKVSLKSYKNGKELTLITSQSLCSSKAAFYFLRRIIHLIVHRVRGKM